LKCNNTQFTNESIFTSFLMCSTHTFHCCAGYFLPSRQQQFCQLCARAHARTHTYIFDISPCIFKYIPRYNQLDATFFNLFTSIKSATCFRRSLRPSSGAQTVYTASGICPTLLLPVAILVQLELQSRLPAC
jgi:hypothetical protein